ncbi:MAG: glycerol-3-phosphate acyltransferase [Acidimicrobiia bacterium]
MTRPPWAIGVAAGAGYLLGTIPSADLATRVATRGSVDLRSAGSGNPGAFNALGVLGRRWGLVVGVADVGKGAAAAFVGRAVAGDIGAHIGGTAAIVGHCYPVWTGFRGGKGVATGIGQFLANFPAALPVEVVIGGIGALSPRRRTLAISIALGAGWVGSGVVWARRGWPNLWGPEASIAMPIAALTSSAIVLHRFVTDRRPRPEADAVPAIAAAPSGTAAAQD